MEEEEEVVVQETTGGRSRVEMARGLRRPLMRGLERRGEEEEAVAAAATAARRRRRDVSAVIFRAGCARARNKKGRKIARWRDGDGRKCENGDSHNTNPRRFNTHSTRCG